MADDVVPDVVVEVVIVVVVVVVVVGVVIGVEVAVVVIVEGTVVVLVTVEVHSSPHITGQCASANSWCTPPTLQSAMGIRDPQPAASSTAWHICGW